MQYILQIIKNVINILLFVFCCTNVKAQTNLVPNPSFEQYTNCPINTTYQGSLIGKPDIWYKPDLRGANYINVCTNNQPFDGIPYCRLNGDISYQYPRTGDAYFSMFYGNNNLNNYVQIKLIDSLKANKYYYAEYYVSLWNTCSYACNNQSMLFTKNTVYADTATQCLLLANPQITNYGNPIITDTINWVKVSGIFKAQGGEQYLTLGNFKTWSNTKRLLVNNNANPGIGYYIDDVAVYELDSFCLKADAGRDTTIKVGDSVFIGSYTNGIDSLMWLQNGTTKYDSIRPGFWYTPSTTGTFFFVLQQIVNGCFSSDTVYINAVLPLNFISYNVISTKEKSIENVWTTANEINVSYYNIQRSINGKDFTTIGTVKAHNKNHNLYPYTDKSTRNEKQETWYYRIEAIDNDGKKTFSTVQQITIKSQTPNSISIYPNPANDNVNVLANESIKEIKIINQLGQVLQHQTPNAKLSTINCKLLTKGIYIVQAVLSNGTTQNQKLIIQ